MNMSEHPHTQLCGDCTAALQPKNQQPLKSSGEESGQLEASLLIFFTLGSIKQSNTRHRSQSESINFILFLWQTDIVTASGVTYFMWDSLGSKREGDKGCEKPRHVQHISTTPYIIKSRISTFWKIKSRSYSFQFPPTLFGCVWE